MKRFIISNESYEQALLEFFNPPEIEDIIEMSIIISPNGFILYSVCSR